MTTLVDAPTRVDGVQLIGEMTGSGYRNPPALVRRSDGQVMQLTPLLYLVLAAADGRRSCAEIAEQVSRAMQRGVSEDVVRGLVDDQLRPLGLVLLADGSEPDLKRSNPLLALRPRIAITSQEMTRRLTDPFRFLFRSLVPPVVLVAFAAVLVWVFFERGLAASAYDAFERPHLLLLVFVVSVLSGGFHEFGHAAAARYSGAEPGAMGAGLYVVWPAFYTDVTDSYRLGRAGRIRTDLGGLYFNAIVVVLTFVWWWATGWEALLLLVATQTLQMVQQLLPLLRYDGYHLLADLAGVPDLYHRIRPTLVGLLPHRWNDPENRVLTPWARLVITLWVLVTVPLMALMLYALIVAVPRLLGSAGSVVKADADAIREGWASGNLLDVAGHSLQLLGVVLPMVACVVILGRIGHRWFAGLAKWSHGSLARRLGAAVLSAVMVTAVSWAWWPHPGAYRPIQPGEQGLFTTLLSAPQAAPAAGLARPGALTDAPVIGAAAETRLSGDQTLVAAFEQGKNLPTKEEPQLAMVLVPAEQSGADDPPTPTTSAEPTDAPTGDEAVDPDEPWVFPFNAPLPPEEGDNQALAVNTTDESVVYDVAFALVWADGSEVLNVNEAHAYASCSNCVAVAVAFQVVLIMEDAQVVVPQNLAVAANYDCYECITAAIASQLVLTVQETPTEEELYALGAVWNELLAFAADITSYSLDEVIAQLDAFEQQILEILGEAPPIEPSPSESPSASPTGEAEDSPSPTSSIAPSPTSSGAASPSPTAQPSTSTSSTSSSPSTAPSPSPSAASTSTAPSPTASSGSGASAPSSSPSP